VHTVEDLAFANKGL